MMTMVQDPPSGTMSDLMVHSSTWEAEAYQHALALKNLRPAGWDDRLAATPTTEAVNGALTYIRLAAELRLPALGEPFISPMSEGGVQLEWDNRERHVEVEITADGNAKYVRIDRDNPTFGEFGSSPARELLGLFGWLTAMP